MNLSGKSAIVTGSATGLGAAVAEGLARRGANVVINFTKSEKEAQETAARCEALGVKAVLAQGNVALDADCKAMAEKALAAFGRIDILVNNAGTTKFADHANLDALTAEDFLNIYGINVVGAYQMTRAVAKQMKAQGYGAIVNVASIAGVTGIGSSIAYAASKGALITMTLSLARALAPEIRVNAVCPGFIGTRWFSDRFGGEALDRIADQQRATTPLKRAGTPEDIADSVVFFCAEGAQHITGETLIVDAGMHLDMAPMSRR
ncbi:MAG: glucose 1-dehydrogenase [Alphaproteobacteria bacterium]|nr:glucose 1-dehydrogenase [Alphaproteobacteria bacterium]